MKTLTRYLLISGITGIVSGLLYFAVPLIQSDLFLISAVEDRPASKDFDERNVKIWLRDVREKLERELFLPYGYFMDIQIIATLELKDEMRKREIAKIDPDLHLKISKRVTKIVKTENIILYMGISLIIFYFLLFAYRNEYRFNWFSKRGGTAASVTVAKAEDSLSLQKLIESKDIIEILKRDIDFTRRETTKFRKNSLQFLISGISLGLIGIIYYSVALSDPQTSGLPLVDFAKHHWRTTVLLIFVETVSVYLTRQYAKSMAHYAQFFRMHNEKHRILYALNAEQFTSTTEEKIAFAKQLITSEPATTSDVKGDTGTSKNDLDIAALIKAVIPKEK